MANDSKPSEKNNSKTGLFLFVSVGLVLMFGVVFAGFYAEDTIMPWYLGKPPGKTMLSTPHAVILEPRPQASKLVPTTLAPAPEEKNLPVRNGLMFWLRGDAVPSDVVNGGLIIAIPDASPARNDAKQGVPIFRPRYIASSINGKPAIRFDGIDDNFYFEDELAKGTQEGFTPATVYAVWSRQSYCESDQYPDGTGFHRLYSSGALGPDYLRGGIYGNVYDPKVNEPVMLRPNKYYAPLTPPTLHKAVFTSPVDLRRFWLGRFNAAQEQHFTGELAEILMFNRVLSADEQQKVESYLKTKYALK